MSTEIVINKTQEKALKSLVKTGGKVSVDGFDKRTINALSKRDLVKVTENKKGTFVAATAKAKKILN